jgi:putative addiction module CopG family antidote
MIELTPQQQQFVDSQIATGVFKAPSEVVGAALELLQERQGEYDQLKDAIAQIEHGEVSELDPDDIKRRGRERSSRR